MNVKQIEKFMDIAKTVVAVLLSFALTILLICLISSTPLETVKDFFFGPFQTTRRIGNIIEMAIPICFTGCAICIMYTTGHINMGSSGYFYVGGLAASAIACNILLPAGVHPVVCILGGGIVAAMIASIPAILCIKWDINEVVSSLMLNYIWVYLGTWILRTFLIDPQAGFNASSSFLETAKLPRIISGTRIHLGLVIAVVVVLFSWFFLKKTKWGYQIRMMGVNSKFSVYSGMSVTGILLASQMLGGFLAGIGGATEVLGMYTRFEWAAAPSTGFDGIMVAAIAHRNPALVPIASLFLAYVRVGADVISRTSDVPIEIVSIIQALIIMLVGAQMFLAKIRHKQIVKASVRDLAKEKEVK